MTDPACPDCASAMRPAVDGGWYCHACLTRDAAAGEDNSDERDRGGRHGLAGELVETDASEVSR